MTVLPFLTPITKLLDKNYYESIVYIEKIAKGVIKKHKNSTSDNVSIQDVVIWNMKFVCFIQLGSTSLVVVVVV